MFRLLVQVPVSTAAKVPVKKSRMTKTPSQISSGPASPYRKVKIPPMLPPTTIITRSNPVGRTAAKSASLWIISQAPTP